MTNDAVNDSAGDDVHDSVNAGVQDSDNEGVRAPVTDIDQSVVRDLVSDVASRVVHLIAGDSVAATEQDRCLRELAALMAIRAAADELATVAAISAASNGAMYPAIGDAAGMTRQAARVRWPGLTDLARKAQRRPTVTGTRTVSTAPGEGI
ncbi:hypothetical protein [Micromonospora sp. S4605]|uniref:hypothetical protein n=1 Tax=Micromonospora sp. S4605 TaxID=1420897 RepID=UPI0011B7D99F|nr:hypothetical protein [Micromonospora sp. S4605]